MKSVQKCRLIVCGSRQRGAPKNVLPGIELPVPDKNGSRRVVIVLMRRVQPGCVFLDLRQYGIVIRTHARRRGDQSADACHIGGQHAVASGHPDLHEQWQRHLDFGFDLWSWLSRQAADRSQEQATAEQQHSCGNMTAAEDHVNSLRSKKKMARPMQTRTYPKPMIIDQPISAAGMPVL